MRTEYCNPNNIKFPKYLVQSNYHFTGFVKFWVFERRSDMISLKGPFDIGAWHIKYKK